MFAKATVVFTRAAVMSVAATVVFVAADATNPVFLGARRLCTRVNAVFVRNTEASAGKPQIFASEASDFPCTCSVKRPS